MEIKLSREAGKKIFEYAENAGVTAEELIKGFIADLTGTAGNHGSDEREAAQAWYERAHRPTYSVYQAVNAVMWDIDTLIETIEQRQGYINDLASLYRAEDDDERNSVYFEIQSRNDYIEEVAQAYYENGGEDFRHDLSALIRRYKSITEE